MKTGFAADGAAACVKLLKGLDYSVSKDDSTPAMPHHHSLCDGLTGVYSFARHIFGVLILFSSSLIGVALPLLAERVACLRDNTYAFAIARAAATGTLLSVSTIHLISEGAAAFLEPCVREWLSGYQAYAFLFALIAALAIQALNIELAALTERWIRRNRRGGAADTTVLGDRDQPMPYLAPHQKLFQNSSDRCFGSYNASNYSGPAPTEPSLRITDHSMRAQREGYHGHQHFFELPQDMGMVHKVISALCMEFGITFHSFFVGIAVGLTTDGELKPLLVALFFHQTFEGMTLGSLLMDAKLRGALEAVLAAVFTLSAPSGMLVSIAAVSASRDAMSGPRFVAAMAVLDSLCGGVLLYLAFTLLLFDFPDDICAFCSDEVPGWRKRKLGLFLALWIGMALMAFAGKWL